MIASSGFSHKDTFKEVNGKDKYTVQVARGWAALLSDHFGDLVVLPPLWVGTLVRTILRAWTTGPLYNHHLLSITPYA